MKRKKQLGVIVVLGAVVVLGVSATARQYVNLKVLPKDISSKDLQGIMTDDFEDGLGVSCGFCHAPAKGGHGLDFASDAKPEKEVARGMMRMVLRLNKKYFKVRHPLLGSEALVVNCATCHKGKAFPDGN